MAKYFQHKGVKYKVVSSDSSLSPWEPDLLCTYEKGVSSEGSECHRYTEFNPRWQRLVRREYQVPRTREVSDA